jgi:4-hydroxybenzoate polyprenyltransferase
MSAVKSENLLDRAFEYALLMRWDRPIGALLLLWPTLWALWLAGDGQPDQWVVLIFLLGVWVMRSAGCVVNDIADREFDPHVSRTRNRPLAAGRITLREASLVALTLGLIALGLALLLDRLVLLLAVVGALLAASYPFMKRFHHLPQLNLGLAFGWSIPMAYAALTGTVPGVVWLLFTANIAWVLVYDTEYAMADREDDLKIGVKSSAILFGEHDKRMIAILQVTTLLLLVLVGMSNGLGGLYYLGLLAAGWLFLYQQYLIRDRDPALCFKAFLNNNAVGLLVFCGLLLDRLP